MQQTQQMIIIATTIETSKGKMNPMLKITQIENTGLQKIDFYIGNF